MKRQSALSRRVSPNDGDVPRRDLLFRAGGGLGGMALTWLLGCDGYLNSKSDSKGTDSQTSEASQPQDYLLPGDAAKAKHVIVLFCAGGVSQVDTYDYKPELFQRSGQPFDDGFGTSQIEFFESHPGNYLAGPWQFHQHGQSGLWMSELLPNLAGCVDDIAFIHSMVAKSAVHGPALFLMNTGFNQSGFPSMGSWVTYGLGSGCDNLPVFVVLPDSHGNPKGGPPLWSAGFLPAKFQGTPLRGGGNAPLIGNLFPPNDPNMTEASQIDARRYLQKLNTTHAAQREADLELEARIAAYELAARLQLSAPEVADLNGETQSTLQNYGIGEEPTDDFGRRCLLARRMVERGVRFVHVWCGADEATTVREDWDAHDDLVKNHGLMGKTFDKPAAALLKDLKARGLLGETLVICATEFGRMPAAQEALGRDHNPNAFTCWMAGAGVKGGVSYGKTDDFSYKVIKNPVQCHDLHATALHLLGVDHTKLTYRHNSVKRRLTDVHGHVISKILT